MSLVMNSLQQAKSDSFVDINLDPRGPINFTRQIIEQFGPRLAGSEASINTAEALKKEFHNYADRVESQDFEVHPKSFLGWLKVLTILTIFALIFLWANLPLVAAIIQTVGFFFVFEFLFYRTEFDKFWPKRTGRNVWATIEPSQEVKQQIIVSGHHDSAFVYNYLEKIPTLYGLVNLSMFGSIIILYIFQWVWAIMAFFTSEVSQPIKIIRIILTIIILFLILPAWFFLGKSGTPGAGDNMISTAIANEIGKIFAKQKANGKGLEHTRLIIASWDAEEAGLRGSRAFCKQYGGLAKSVPCFNFNLECLYRMEWLLVLTSDLNNFVQLSKKMADECQQITTTLGYNLAVQPFPFLAGGTDAAEFAKIGVEAICLVGMPLTVGSYATKKPKPFNSYHTTADTIDAIQPEIIKAVLEILYLYLRKKDQME